MPFDKNKVLFLAKWTIFLPTIGSNNFALLALASIICHIFPYSLFIGTKFAVVNKIIFDFFCHCILIISVKVEHCLFLNRFKLKIILPAFLTLLGIIFSPNLRLRTLTVFAPLFIFKPVGSRPSPIV